MLRFINRLSVVAVSSLLLSALIFAPTVVFAQATGGAVGVPGAGGGQGQDQGGGGAFGGMGQDIQNQGQGGGGAGGGSSSSSKDGVCEGIQMATGKSCDDPDTAGEVDSLVKTIINMLSVVVGVVAVIMIIIGGLKYITSGGDSNNITSAKNTIMYAVIGLVIVALAQIIVTFVLSNV